MAIFLYLPGMKLLVDIWAVIVACVWAVMINYGVTWALMDEFYWAVIG